MVTVQRTCDLSANKLCNHVFESQIYRRETAAAADSLRYNMMLTSTIAIKREKGPIQYRQKGITKIVLDYKQSYLGSFIPDLLPTDQVARHCCTNHHNHSYLIQHVWYRAANVLHSTL